MKMSKRLGQVFLKDQATLAYIVKSAEIKKGEKVIEIGPGSGALTEYLLRAHAEVIAIEKDKNWVSYLKNHLSDKQLKIIHADVRDVYQDIIQSLGPHFKIVANIPYYLASYLIRLILSNNPQPDLCILMVQKEVAQRLIGWHNQNSLLSIATQLYSKVTYLKTVPKSYFEPQPKVDSALVKIQPYKNTFSQQYVTLFFKLLHAGFIHPRKYLISNLAEALSISKESLQSIFLKCSLSPKIRPEELNLADWKCLFKELYQLE